MMETNYGGRASGRTFANQPKVAGSANASLMTPEQEQMVKQAKDRSQQRLEYDQGKADALGVTVEAYRQFAAYAKKLKEKHPNLSESQLNKRVCKKFKITLVK